MNWHTILNVVLVFAPAVLMFFYLQCRRYWKHQSRRWFIKRLAPDAPDLFQIEKTFESMEKVFASMEGQFDKTVKSLGMKMPKMPRMPTMPDMKGVFEEWYDAGRGKWSPTNYGVLGFKTREAAEAVMASLIIQDPKQIGKMEVVHV